MKVLLDVSAIPDQPAGAGTYVLRLAETLSRNIVAGHDLELTLLARKDDTVRWARIAPGATVAGWAPERRPVRLAWEQARGPSVAGRFGIDVWHGPHYTMPLTLAPLRHTPSVVTIHDLTFFDHPEWHEPSKVRYFRRMIRASAKRASALVCVSQATADRLHELLAPTMPVIVAPHGIDESRFRPANHPLVDAAEDEATLASLGIRPPFVAFVGTIEPRKNILGLIRAVEALPPDTTLVLAGQDGWGTRPVDAAIQRSTRTIVRLGYVDDDVVPALYRRAAVVAYPALVEGFGLPAVEALACGARLVTSSGTSMEEFVGDAALLVSPGDDEALAEGLELAMNGLGPDPDLGPDVAAAFTWEASADRHLDAYAVASSRNQRFRDE
ncbi:MAG TPA: glycosyltransferase family 1 protein [Acidimicrobiales bacterium]|jgi:glycosyltransferase involved in cell wall biosynthesis